MKIYNVINPQRQRTKLGISALNSAPPAAPHPTGELVKRSSKSKIYESYSKTSVLNSSAQNRVCSLPCIRSHWKSGFLGFLLIPFRWRSPLFASCCSWLHMHWDSSVSPEIYRQKDDSWMPFFSSQILPNLSTLLFQLSAAEQRFSSSKAPVTHPTLNSGDFPEFLWFILFLHPPEALQHSWSAGVHLPELFKEFPIFRPTDNTFFYFLT